MPSRPETASAAAAATAIALARILDDLALATPATRRAAARCRRTCRTIIRVLADRIDGPAAAGTIGRRLVAEAQSFAAAADQGAVVREFYAAAEAASGTIERTSSPILTKRYRLARAMAAGFEAALLGAAFVAEARTSIDERSDAIAARKRIDDALQGALDRISDAIGDRAAETLASAAAQASRRLADRAASLRPTVRVTLTRAYPSCAVAWRLYGDPNRGEELLRRSACGTPMFMPTEFDALAPEV